MRLVAYQGLILDFGGVITTDFAAGVSAFCVREGLEVPIYDLTAAKLGLRPEDCVFVDDTPANLVTGRHLGMATVHFTGAPSDFAEIGRLIGIESSCRLRPGNWSLTRHDSRSREETHG